MPLHVVPRYAQDGFGLTFGAHDWMRPPRAALERAAEQVRAAL